MHYVIGDIHNNNRKFAEMLEKIGFSQEDHLYLLGDLFDRNSWEPDPIGVYFNMLKLENRCTVVRGMPARSKAVLSPFLEWGMLLLIWMN